MILDLLSVRSQKQWPEDPNKHLIDYFGQYRDPLWDKMDEWNQEMEEIRNSIPDLQTTLDSLMEDLEIEKRKTFAVKLYKGADIDVTDQLGFKFFVQKMSGNAKFDVDTKITKVHFFHLLEELSTIDVPEEGEIPVAEGEAKTKKVFDEETYKRIKNAFSSSLNPTAATPLYASDQTNADYVAILNCFRSFNPENYATAK